MNKLLKYKKKDNRLQRITVDGVRWITQGHWAAKVKYVQLLNAELVREESPDDWKVGLGNPVSGDVLKKIIFPQEPKKLVQSSLSDLVLWDRFDTDKDINRQLVVSEDLRNCRLIDQAYIFMGIFSLECMIDPKTNISPVYFFDNPTDLNLAVVIMPVRLEGKELKTVEQAQKALAAQMGKDVSKEKERKPAEESKGDG